ncbi:(2Fe-2S)-binding protein [Novosphingobium album (ex Liu et al. 2023)]|uniref:(2Fe-2S)-binding protein n=1 Tax=Novosphingobium album (ex Liu et al. 2023) TaxID=3031130 RepID=A0ABT5WQU6_9SPHN|nr:(2Fe-2S)-binding protein [Novosphingobium album (ex Liu et al. 2023)]MDE8652399.1 (2Fe-2S)-binding protein [Novosphingobium album (ex Liu et al. 2023)]
MPRLTVNDHPVEIALDPRTPLLWGLRDAANLTGTKYGCGVGDCGACMVLVDGEALRSCLITLGECEGRTVTTIEGLSRDRSHPVQQAMVAEQAIQCGFCTPGIVISAAALLARNANPGEAEIKVAIPNLCRCGVYPRLVRAIQLAGRVMRREETLSAAPAPGITVQDAARAVPAMNPTIDQGDPR